MPFLPPNQQRQSTEVTMTFPRLFINSLTFPQCPCGRNQHISMCDMQNRMSIISACTFHVLRTWISQDKATARSQTSSSLIVLRLLQFVSDPSVGLISVISVSVTPPPVTCTHWCSSKLNVNNNQCATTRFLPTMTFPRLFIYSLTFPQFLRSHQRTSGENQCSKSCCKCCYISRTFGEYQDISNTQDYCYYYTTPV